MNAKETYEQNTKNALLSEKFKDNVQNGNRISTYQTYADFLASDPSCGDLYLLQMAQAILMKLEERQNKKHIQYITDLSINIERHLNNL